MQKYRYKVAIKEEKGDKDCGLGRRLVDLRGGWQSVQEVQWLARGGESRSAAESGPGFWTI